MGQSGTERIAHRRDFARYTESGELSSGAGTITFQPIPPGWEYRVNLVSIVADAASPPAGMVGAVYIDSELIPEALVGWDQIVSPAPGIVLDAIQPIVIRGGERIVVAISGAGSTTSARARVSGELVEIESRDWPRPTPVEIAAWASPQIIQPTEWAAEPAEG